MCIALHLQWSAPVGDFGLSGGFLAVCESFVRWSLSCTLPVARCLGAQIGVSNC